MLNPFDQAVLGFLNRFAQRSPTFDDLVVLVNDNNLLKGGFIMALYWWAWFRHGEERKEKREYLLFAMIAGAFAVLVARILAGTLLPFRLRPALDSSLNFRIPFYFNPFGYLTWSSFPSDNATLFFCLAAGLWFVCRLTGAIATAYVFFIVCLPRIHLGIHFPTDIIGGGILGIAMASLARISWLKRVATRYLEAWPEKYPALFYSAMFLYSFEVGEVFTGALVIIRKALSAMHLHHLRGF